MSDEGGFSAERGEYYWEQLKSWAKAVERAGKKARTRVKRPYYASEIKDLPILERWRKVSRSFEPEREYLASHVTGCRVEITRAMIGSGWLLYLDGKEIGGADSREAVKKMGETLLAFIEEQRKKKD